MADVPAIIAPQGVRYLACTTSSRKGAYRLARLADKDGANAEMRNGSNISPGITDIGDRATPFVSDAWPDFCDLGGRRLIYLDQNTSAGDVNITFRE